jgi:hypothetical protein
MGQSVRHRHINKDPEDVVPILFSSIPRPYDVSRVTNVRAACVHRLPAIWSILRIVMYFRARYCREVCIQEITMYVCPGHERDIGQYPSPLIDTVDVEDRDVFPCTML